MRILTAVICKLYSTSSTQICPCFSRVQCSILFDRKTIEMCDISKCFSNKANVLIFLAL